MVNSATWIRNSCPFEGLIIINYDALYPTFIEFIVLYIHLSKNVCHIYSNDTYLSHCSCEQAKFTQKHFILLYLSCIFIKCTDSQCCLQKCGKVWIIWTQQFYIKVSFMMEFRSDYIWGVLVTIQFRTVCIA